MEFSCLYTKQKVLAWVCWSSASWRRERHRKLWRRIDFLPLGSFSDSYDTSLYIGARFEFQDTNALGQVAVLSYMLRAGYAPLRVKDSVKTGLETLGESTDSHMFNAGAGVRAYSSKSPVFLSLGLDYLNLDPAGNRKSQNGAVAALGVGLTWGRESAIIEVEAKGHAAFFADIDNLQYVTVQGNVGIPF